MALTMTLPDKMSFLLGLKMDVQRSLFLEDLDVEIFLGVGASHASRAHLHGPGGALDAVAFSIWKPRVRLMCWPKAFLVCTRIPLWKLFVCVCVRARLRASVCVCVCTCLHPNIQDPRMHELCAAVALPNRIELLCGAGGFIDEDG